MVASMGSNGGGEDDQNWRCIRKNSTGWSCKEKAISGQNLCQKHYLVKLQRSRSKKMPPENQESGNAQSCGLSVEQVGQKRKLGRPLGSENKKKRNEVVVDVQQVPEGQLSEPSAAIKEQVSVVAAGENVIPDCARGLRKIGRPKGSKNKKKLDLLIKGGLNVGGGGADVGVDGITKKEGVIGRPKGSKNKKKIVAGSEVGEIEGMLSSSDANCSGKIADKFVEDNKKEVVPVAENGGLIMGQVPLGNGSGERRDAFAKKKDGRGRPKGSKNKKKGGRGRPKGSKNKKDLATNGIEQAQFSVDVAFEDGNAGGDITDNNHTSITTAEHGVMAGKGSLDSGCADCVVKKDGQGRLMDSKNEKQTVAVHENDGIAVQVTKASDISGNEIPKRKDGRGRPKGLKE